MSQLFIDTAYLVASGSRRDQWSRAVIGLESRVVVSDLVTTDYVLAEYLSFVSEAGPRARASALVAVHRLLDDDDECLVVEGSRARLEAGLALYAARPDKGYSLVDCISMTVMRELGISEALTSDRHFEQEGFSALLR